MESFHRFDKQIIKYLILAGIVILVVMNYGIILSWLSIFLNVVSPLAMGGVLAFIVNLPMRFFERHLFKRSHSIWAQRFRRPLSILISMILILLVIFIVLDLVVPQLISVVVQLIEVVPEVFEVIREWILGNEDFFPEISALVEQFDVNWRGMAQNILNMINNFTSTLIGTTLNTIGSLLGIVVDLFISLMIMLYLLLGKERLIRQLKLIGRTYLPRKIYYSLLYVLDVAQDSFSNFIGGTSIEAMITGVIVTVGMWVFRFPYAPMIGALTSVTTFIPMVGAYLSGAVGFLLIMMESPIRAFFFLIFIVVVQQFEGNVIYPRVVGGSIGLPGLWVLSAITIGGGLFGVWGLLLAVPTASTIYRIIREDVQFRQDTEVQSQLN